MLQGIWYNPPPPQQQYRKIPILPPPPAPDDPPRSAIANLASVAARAWVAVRPHESLLERPQYVWAVDTMPPGVVALVPVALDPWRMPQVGSRIAPLIPIPVTPDNPPIRRAVPNVQDIWQQLTPPYPVLTRLESAILFIPPPPVDNPPIHRFVPNVQDVWRQMAPPYPRLTRAGSAIIPPEPPAPPAATGEDASLRRRKFFRH